MIFTPSEQQQNIFDAIARGDHNILVDAKAGSGKTTTIVEGLRFVPRTGLIAPSKIFLAFNKMIADTLKQRCPHDVICSTFHALGRRALINSGFIEPKVKVDSGKCRWILYDLLDKDNEDFRNILRLVGLLKGGHAVDASDIDIHDLVEFHNLDFDEPGRAIELALKVLAQSDADLKTIDFDDMLHLAVKLNAHFGPRDWVFVDEAQDLNGIQHEIVDRLLGGRTGADGQWIRAEDTILKPRRLVAVGDPHQAIYGFRGAHADSMQRLSNRFSMQTYPLSVSYRCPKAVVREANKHLRYDHI